MSERIADRRDFCRDRLCELLGRDGPLDIVRAALWVAAEEYPDLDVAAETRRIGEHGDEAHRRVGGLVNPFARLDGVRRYIHEEVGLRGDREDYDDPDNSFLNRVLDRRRGIPLTLSILFIEVARRAGFSAVGVGLPGHFVVRVEYGGRVMMVDPFHGGEVITEDDCRRLVARSTGRPSLFRREQLEGTTPEAMLVRLLNNLKRVYLAREDYARALGVVERLLLANPGEPREIRDRGILMSHLGRPGAALVDLESYLALAPGAPDAESVRGRMAWLRKKLGELG